MNGERLTAEPVAFDDDRREVDVGVAAGVTNPGLVKRRNQDALFLERVDPAVVAVVCDGVSSSAAADAAARRLRGGRTRARRRLTSSRPGGRVADRDRSRAACGARRPVAHRRWHGRAVVHVCKRTLGRRDGHGKFARRQPRLLDRLRRDATAHRRRLVDSARPWTRASSTSAPRRPTPALDAITRWLGTDAPDKPPQIVSFAPTDPGRLVVCSDGLWNYEPDTEDFARLVRSHAPGAPLIGVARAARRLRDRVRRARQPHRHRHRRDATPRGIPHDRHQRGLSLTRSA